MTEYQNFFSEDTYSFFRSPVREIFKKVDLNAIYSFAGGYPSADTFPADEIQEAVGKVIARHGAMCFQYGATQGVTALREAVAKRVGVALERVQISSSSQQGIDVCTRILVDPGDVILTSNPSYLGAIQSFRSYRADVRGVAHCADIAEYRRRWVEAIVKARSEGCKIKFLYMIPDFQNPSGETLSIEERQLLVDLAEEYDFLIVEDSPYRELRYEGEDVPTMYSLSEDRVILLGSFSKILAPGFRLGWIIANPQILDQIYVCKQSLDLCPPMLDQYVAEELLSSGVLDANLSKSIALYRRKRDLMISLLEEHMPQGVSWTHPEGGLFLYLTLPEDFDSVAFYDTALANSIAYVAGSFFRTDGKGQNTMRLNFSFMTEEKMRAGMEIFGRILRSALK